MSVGPEVPSRLKFNPDWIFDPVPWQLLQYLDKRVVFELARVHFDARKAILAAEVKAIDEAQAILRKAAGG